jgi:FkbM family methyltransferase
MYSQNNEEQFIVNFFENFIGSFMDIGAYDGKTFSNTHRLAELGWGGVCIEPSPSVFPSLQKLYKDNNKITLCDNAVSSSSGPMTFYDSGGDAISSFDKSHKSKWEQMGVNFKEVTVNAITTSDVFDKFGFDCDFLNLDVEGTNWQIFSALPLKKLTKLKLICVEHDSHIDQMVRKCSELGFKTIHTNGENIILGRKNE